MLLETSYFMAGFPEIFGSAVTRKIAAVAFCRRERNASVLLQGRDRDGGAPSDQAITPRTTRARFWEGVAVVPEKKRLAQGVSAQGMLQGWSARIWRPPTSTTGNRRDGRPRNRCMPAWTPHRPSGLNGRHRAQRWNPHAPGASCRHDSRKASGPPRSCLPRHAGRKA